MDRASASPSLILAAFMLLTGSAARAASYSVLYSFSGADGDHPAGRLAMDAEGNLYGTTENGGKFSVGTLFRWRDAHLQVLHHFNGSDGASPWGSLLADGEGNLYGTTKSGGSGGGGVVYRWDRELGLRALKSFGQGAEGMSPFGGLTRDAEGTLYGTTFYGGNMACGSVGCGTLFKISPAGAFTVLRVFSGSDGYGPNATLYRVNNKLYGTTVYNSTTGPAVAGSPFSINTDGTGFATTPPNTLSCNFMGGLVKDKQGNLWGAAMRAGSAFLGGIYKIDTSGAYHLVYTFHGSDGAYPTGTLVIDESGALYGVTKGNGTWAGVGSGEGGFGTVFKFDPSTNALTTLHVFTGTGGDGKNPFSGLVADPSGALYGVAEYGGTADHGILFRVVP
jgi:uncharacterized repeat protein (TIGR03803 family)